MAKKRRTMHVDDTMWNAAAERAASEGKSLTEVLNGFLTEYVEHGLPDVDPPQ